LVFDLITVVMVLYCGLLSVYAAIVVVMPLWRALKNYLLPLQHLQLQIAI
jgi:hypothetical protein